MGGAIELVQLDCLIQLLSGQIVLARPGIERSQRDMGRRQIGLQAERMKTGLASWFQVFCIAQLGELQHICAA